MIVEAWTVHLYCASCRKFGDYSDVSRKESRARARKDGWKFTNGDVLCRKCSSARKPEPFRRHHESR